MRGPALQPGDRVRLVSPASYPTREWLDTSVKVLEGWGFRAEVASHALDERGPMAGRDEDRAADLNDAFSDPDVRAIVAITGGMGSYRIADHLDFAALSVSAV